ncbi:MAG: SDR family oxidoreductase [Candidatus Humimicrobiia bacterium]
MRIFITGGSGLLGCALAFELIKKNEVISGYYHNYISIKNNNFSSVNIDICDINSLKAIEKSPDVIIHAAALTDLEFCEKNPEIAYKINVDGTKNVLKVAEKCNAKIVYICTDYIFDGEKRNHSYSEADTPNPLSIYAKTKLQGEELIKESYDNFISVRTSLYGWSLNKSSFASWIVNSLREGKRISVLSDQISSMLFTNDLANILSEMLKYNLKGVYNVASADSVSKYKFALKIAEIFNLNKNLIEAITLDNLIKRFSLSANRPMNVSLDVSKIENKLGRKMPSIREGITSMKEKEIEFKETVIVK